MSWMSKKTIANPAVTPVRCISKSIVKSHLASQESQKPVHLTPWDLVYLQSYYSQYGLVYTAHDDEAHDMSAILRQLKHSLSTALTYFFPLVGRLVTQDIQHLPSHHHVFIDCKDPPGVGFIHSIADATTVSDVLSDHALTTLFPFLFPLDPGTHNSQGHTLPLLLVQVTQLVDGIFIAFSWNHAVADGVSFWHFINSWSEICRKQNSALCEPNECVISHPPITKRWCFNDQHSIVNLPNNSTTTRPPNPLQANTTQRVFHFTSKSVAAIRAKANAKCNHTNQISSFQAVAAFTWRSTTRARRLLPDQNTTCVILIDSRSRLEPPLPKNYFGNFSQGGSVTCPVGELLSNNLGKAAWMLHNKISNHTYHNNVRPFLEEFTMAPSLQTHGDAADPGALLFGSSTKFDLYGNDFGWGPPVALRWFANKVDGIVQSVPGREKGSVDFFICLLSESMSALEADDEFMHVVSPTNLNLQSDLRSRY